MADVKWIKITTDIFDNRKIRQIETLPDGDAIIVIWMKLLCLAGNINDGGDIYFTEEVPYTDQMLATQFGRPLNTIKLALDTFRRFKMIDVIDDILHISNWEKYQNIEGMEKIREQNRIRKQRQRNRAKLPMSDVTGQSRDSHTTDKKKKEKRKEVEEEENISLQESDDPSSPTPKKPVRHKYGEYLNVLLSDQDIEKLKDEFIDWEQRIERLSEYMASTGKSYKSHLATIRNWAKRDKDQPQQKKNQKSRLGWIDDLMEGDENIIDVQ